MWHDLICDSLGHLSVPHKDLGWQRTNIVHSSFPSFSTYLSHLLHLSVTPCWSIYQKAIILKHHYKWNQCSGKPINLYILPLPQAQDLNVIEEVIRMMLEIINSCLCNSLHHNPNLVYALLYKRELFEQFRTHPSFQDIMQNLDTVSLLWLWTECTLPHGVDWFVVIIPNINFTQIFVEYSFCVQRKFKKTGSPETNANCIIDLVCSWTMTFWALWA